MHLQLHVHPQQATKTLSSRVDTHALLLTVQSWAIQPPSLLANGAKQLLEGSNSRPTDKTREDTHLIRVHWSHSLVGPANSCTHAVREWELPKPTSTHMQPCLPLFQVARCTCPYTPVSQKASLQMITRHSKKLKAPEQIWVCWCFKPSSNGSLPTTANTASA